LVNIKIGKKFRREAIFLVKRVGEQNNEELGGDLKKNRERG